MINGPMISKLAPYACGKKNTKRKAKSKRKPKILKSVVAELASQIKAPPHFMMLNKRLEQILLMPDLSYEQS